MSKTQTAYGFFDRIREYAADLYAKAQESQQPLLTFLLSFGVGFISGFLLKRYAQYVFISALFIISLVVLQQTDFITISWNVAKLEHLFGIKSVAVTSDLFSVIWTWVRANAGLTICFIIGFIIGLKLA